MGGSSALGLEPGAARTAPPDADALAGTKAAAGSRLARGDVALMLLAAAPAFIANYFVILDHFYVRGPFLRDSAWFAATMRDWGQNPAVLGGGTIFSTHAFLIFLPTSLLAHAFSLTGITVFALFHAASYGIFSAALAWWCLLVAGRHFPARLAAVTIAAAFAFNGLNISMIAYPHVEEMAPGLMLAGLVAVALQRFRLAAAWFFVACLIREDVGLHIGGFLLVVAVLRRLVPPRKWQLETLYLATACIAYAACAIALHAIFLPQDNAFARVYLGRPPLAHLTAALLTHRLALFFACRFELWLPALVAAVVAVLERNPLIMAGWIATAPWLILNLCANDELAGQLLGYYSYPFVVALCWPLIGTTFRGGDFSPERTNPWEVFGLAGVLLACTISAMLAAGGSDNAVWQGMLPRTAVIGARRSYARTGALLQDGTHNLGHIMVDQCVAGLYPDAFQPDELVGDSPAAGIDTVLMFDGCRRSDRALGQAKAAGIGGGWQRFDGTKILVSSKHKLPDAWRAVLAPTSHP